MVKYKKKNKREEKEKIKNSLSFSNSQVDPNAGKFCKSSFLLRESDESPNGPICVWSIENHILIVKWIPTDVPGQYQITNRYNLWNRCETHRYKHLEIPEKELTAARESGFLRIPLFSNKLE